MEALMEDAPSRIQEPESEKEGDLEHLRKFFETNRQLLKSQESTFYDFKPIECFVHFKWSRSLFRFCKYFLAHMIYFYLDFMSLPVLLIFFNTTELKNMKFTVYGKQELTDHITHICNLGMLIIFSYFGKSFKLPRTIPVINFFATSMRAMFIAIRYATTNENRFRN
jgi:hypothetical protein